MLIAWLEPATAKVQGDQLLRTHQPCEDLAAHCNWHTVHGPLLHPAMRLAARTADLLVCAQVVDPELLGIFAERRAAGRATVYEINDNVLAPTAHGGAKDFYLAPAQRALTLQLAAAADGLQLSSRYLGERFGPLCRRSIVLPNAVDLPAPLAFAPAGLTRLRLGWGGSAGHADDLLALRAPLEELLQRLPNLELAIMGPTEILHAVDWVPKDRLHYRPDGDYATYRAFLATLTVGLAPLQDTPFNRGRSDVKALEYAGAGAVALVQRAPAYADVLAAGAAVGFDGDAELVQRASALLQNADARNRQRERAHAYLVGERTREKMVVCRAAWLQSVVASCGGRPGDDVGPRLAAILAAAPTAKASGNAVHVQLDAAAAHLYNGLCEVQAGRRGDDDFRRAVARRPDDAYGQLYFGYHVACPRQAALALRRARRLAPQSVAVAWAAAERALAAGDAASALALWRARPQMVATYAPFALCTYRAMRALGAAADEAAEPLLLALADSIAHPDLALALAQWAAGAADDGDAAARRRWAKGAIVRALALAAEPAALWVALARLQRADGDTRACLRTLRPLLGDAARPGAQPRAVVPPGLQALAYALAADACAKLGRNRQAAALAQAAQGPVAGRETGLRASDAARCA